MSLDVITVGSTMRISLMYWGEYSQWRERFMNYLEKQTDGEAMINSIQNGLPNDIYSLIDSNETAKDLWDALERQIRGSKYGEQDRKATILFEYETFKASKGEQLLDTYLHYLQVINDLKKCGYKKDNCELNYKFLNNLQPEWKQYGTLMRQTNNLMDINIDALYNILKQNQGDVNDALGCKKKPIVINSDPLALVVEKIKVSKQKEEVVVSLNSKGSGLDDFSELKKITVLLAKAFNRRKFYSKPTNNNLRTSSTSQSANNKQEFVKSDDKKVEKKDDEKKRDMSKVKCYNCKKEGHFAKYCKKAKVKDNNYYKTKMLLAKKDSDEHVLLSKDQAWMESSSDSDKEINANMVFMVQIEKVLSESDESSSSAEETIAELAYYTSESESESEYETLEYYDNSTNYGLFVNNNDDQKNFHDATESASENFNKNYIDFQKDYDKSEVDHNDSEEKEHLVDKLIRNFNHNVAKCHKRIEKANQQSKYLENQNKDIVLKNHVNTFEEKNKEFNEQIKVLNEKNADLLAETEVLQDQLKVKYVVIDTHTECQAQYAKLEKERYEYMIKYSALCDNDKQHRKKIDKQEILFDKMSQNQSENDCLVVEKECDKVEYPKVIAPGMFKLSVSQSVSPISMLKTSCDSKNVENLDTFSSVRRPKNSDVIWKKKASSNTSNVDLSCFLGTVRFGNNDYLVITGYGDVVIGSMTTKKVYYVEGLGHNLFSVRQFCDKGLEVAFRKSTCFVRNEDGVDLLIGDRSSNLYTIALNEVASNPSTFF
nr:integrase, catalytic region, zinc finger, CCHC-type, peptidase aspartic, catalytic [Tanacetum cinerariifolium]